MTLSARRTARPLAARLRPRHAGVAALAAVILLLPGVAAAQTESASVTATVTVNDPIEVCIILRATSIDFGVLEFGETATSEPYQVTSCSKGDQRLYAETSNATSADEEVVWTAADQPWDNYFAVDAALDEADPVLLSGDPAYVAPLRAEMNAEATHTFHAPDRGSDGAGEPMTFQLTWTGALAD